MFVSCWDYDLVSTEWWCLVSWDYDLVSPKGWCLKREGLQCSVSILLGL